MHVTLTTTLNAKKTEGRSTAWYKRTKSMRWQLTANNANIFFYNQTRTEQPSNTRLQANDYYYEGYRIHETFDPVGPSFSDCIVRLFTE